MALNEKQLYADLVNDICGIDYPKYDNLVIFVQDFLHNKVKSWCYNDSVLRGGLHDEDVMQEIQIRIIKKCENYFFKPVDGKTDKTCEEFKAWCYRVAKNYFLTYCVRQKNKKEVELKLSLKIDNGVETSNTDDNRQDIKKCFAIVMDLKSKPHIVLTWLSVSLLMVYADLSKIEATHVLAEKFSEMTLYEMFYIVVKIASRYNWLDINEEHWDKQMKKLENIDDDTGKKIGEMRYEEFYMNKGPEKSISDWINRVNAQIKKKMDTDKK